MSFKKTTRGESHEVLSPAEHRVVDTQLQRTGKSSVEAMTDTEKEALQQGLDIAQTDN